MSYSPSPETLERVARAVALYPRPGAALMPVLRIIQDEAGFISPEAERWAAGRLGLSPVRVREAVTFYTMFRRRPAGRTVIEVCRNLSCALAGAEDLVAYLRGRLGLPPGSDTTADGRFTLLTVECLGNCDHAPCLQVDGVDRGPMTRETAETLIRELEAK
ncbi:MAG: NAD(P)H-dependent oxidoreductase subunit E [Acidobacteria bacterium]|nr:NAD(P)H-dependent oxidoreductase subunit E [Acidobacteriota bacterium]